jgi:hypothetical protein
MSSESPPLTRSDAWLIAALCESGPKPLRLQDLIQNADWLNRAIPSYDELSFGLRRLEAAGYLDVMPATDGLIVRPTERSFVMVRAIKARTLGELLAEMSAAVGARPYPEPEHEDRSLGRLPGLDEAAWQAAIAAYRRSFLRDLGSLAAIFAALVGAIGAAVVWLNTRRRRP